MGGLRVWSGSACLAFSKPWVWWPAPYKSGVEMHTCNLSTRQEDQKFKVNPSYIHIWAQPEIQEVLVTLSFICQLATIHDLGRVSMRECLDLWEGLWGMFLRSHPDCRWDPSMDRALNCVSIKKQAEQVSAQLFLLLTVDWTKLDVLAWMSPQWWTVTWNCELK